MDTSSNIIIDIKTPQSWSEATQNDLRTIYRLLAAELTITEVCASMLLHWGGIEVIGAQPDGSYLCRYGGKDIYVTSVMVAEAMQNLQWLQTIPDVPVRLDTIRKAKACEADLSDLSFENYLAVENLYQGFLVTQQDDLLKQAAQILYTGRLPEKLTDMQAISVFYWLAGLKAYNAKRYPDLFSESAQQSENLLGSAPEAHSPIDSMNAQIRALTKGDISKEAEILAMPCERALVELNAQAKEYKEFNAKIKKS